MSEFIYDPNSGELYHYGVKGMKWGVRRAIGKKARAYAKGYYANKKLTKKAAKLDKKIGKATEKYGKSSDKVKSLKAKRSSVRKSMTSVRDTMKKNVSGLSKKDIAQGKRDYMTRKAAKAVLGMTMAAATGYGAVQVGRGLVLANRVANAVVGGLGTVGGVASSANTTRKTVSAVSKAASTISWAMNVGKSVHNLNRIEQVSSKFPHLR